MITLAQLLLGVVVAAGLIAYGRRLRRRREILVYAQGLAVAALIYVAFAVAGAGLEAVWVEALGLAVFAAAAVLGWRWSPWVLALGWAAHTGWDAVQLPEPYVPDWYAVACLSFDVLLAGYIGITIVLGGRRRSKLADGA